MLHWNLTGDIDNESLNRLVGGVCAIISSAIDAPRFVRWPASRMPSCVLKTVFLKYDSFHCMVLETDCQRRAHHPISRCEQRIIYHLKRHRKPPCKNNRSKSEYSKKMHKIHCFKQVLTISTLKLKNSVRK